MTFEVTTQPGAEPLDLATVKTFLKVTSNDDDALIEMMITAVRQWAEKTTGMRLLTQTLKQYWDTWPTCAWELGAAPVASVTSIQYIDEDGATQTWAASNYTADTKSWIPRIVPTEDVDYKDLGEYPNAVICTFVAGYTSPDDVPADARMAMLQKIAFLYENREDMPTGGAGNGYRVRSADSLLFQNRIHLV